MTEISIQEEAKVLRQLKEQYTEAKAEYESLKAQFDAHQAQLLERMENESVEGLKVEGINFVPTKTIYGKITDRKEFVEWAEQEMPELLESRERKEVLNEFIRQQLDDGEVLPPGAGFYERNYISQRAAGGK